MQLFDVERLHNIVIGVERTQLDATIAAIKSARIGIYRIDATATPDAFLALGIALGLNRPGLLMHHSGSRLPANVSGLSKRAFAAFSKLDQATPASLLERYRR